MKLGYEFRTGPLEWADRVGLDKVLNWMEHILPGDRRAPLPSLPAAPQAGSGRTLGARAGQGFFTYGATASASIACRRRPGLT